MMTLIIMTSNKNTLSILKSNIMKLSITKLGRMLLSIIKHIIINLSVTTLGKRTLSITSFLKMTFGKMPVSKNSYIIRHSAQQHSQYIKILQFWPFK
jgi:hypothetical protein